MSTAPTVDDQIDQYRAKGGEAAEMVCRHLTSKADDGDWFFMRAPRTGQGWFLCRACCRHNVELMQADAAKERWSNDW